MKLDPEDFQTYKQRLLFENKESLPNGFTIFFAVLCAILVAWLIGAAYLEWQMRQALHEMNHQAEVAARQSQVNMRQIQLNNEARHSQAQEAARLQAVKRAEEKRQQLQQHYEALEHANALKIAEARKNQAWERFYKPVAGCEAGNLNRKTVKCGNDYIRSRRLFEAKWQNGLAE